MRRRAASPRAWYPLPFQGGLAWMGADGRLFAFLLRPSCSGSARAVQPSLATRKRRLGEAPPCGSCSRAACQKALPFLLSIITFTEVCLARVAPKITRTETDSSTTAVVPSKHLAEISGQSLGLVRPRFPVHQLPILSMASTVTPNTAPLGRSPWLSRCPYNLPEPA